MDQENISENLDQDWLWIKGFQEQGERSAFDNIFNKYKTIIINLSYRFVKDQGTAEEIAQDVFIKIYEKKVKFDPKSKFSTWLYRVTVNASLDWLRRRKKVAYSLNEEIRNDEGEKRTHLETLADPNASSPVKNVEQNEMKLIVQREIDRLPDPLRAVLLLFQFQELPYREIARILGISEKAVERRICHAREALRGKLSKYL